MSEEPLAFEALDAEISTLDSKPSSLLENHLRRYISNNGFDFFLHKDLSGFLSRELDFYLKNEVLNLENLILGEESRSGHWFQLMQIVKSVGIRIIAFLAQVEDFQISLWEKQKFITETQYCICLEHVDVQFYDDILNNDAQWQEWKELFGIDGNNRSGRFLDSHPTLVLDTKHFCTEFKDRILSTFTNLDESIDGLLVHSENWQALNFLAERYRTSVRCTYIDPPFNTEDSQFLFKDTYQNSTWLSLMYERLRIGRQFIETDGTFYLHLDHNCNHYGRFLINDIFGEKNLLNEVVWRIGWVSGYKTSAAKYVRNHETIFVVGVQPQPFFNKSKAKIPYKSFKEESIGEYLDSIKKTWKLPRTTKSNLRVRLIFRDDRDQVYKIGITDKEGAYNVEDTWNCSEYEELHSNKIKRNAVEYTPNGSILTQKPEQLLRRVIEVSSEEGDIVLDYFAGSGTTPAVAKKLGRKFVAVEMGGYFDSDLLWRMKQVLFGKEVGISKQVGHSGGGMFKYLRLESYEDTLDNIEFDEETQEMKLKFPELHEEFFLNYMLPWNTKNSRSLLNVEKLESPFDYCLWTQVNGKKTIRNADIPETFNYLIGLKIQSRRTYKDGARKYLVFKGATRTSSEALVVVIWRETKGWQEVDFLRDKKFIYSNNLIDGAEIIYINGESCLSGATPIERVFKARILNKSNL